MKALKKQLAFCLAVVMLMSLLPGAISAKTISSQGENDKVEIINDDHSARDLAAQQMNKTLTYDSVTKQYYLELSVGGFSYTEHPAIAPEPLYTVLVLDATSSMSEKDGGKPEATLWDNVAAAAKTYVDTLFANANGREIHIAIVSFGYGARVHTLGNPNNVTGVLIGDRTTRSPKDPKAPYSLDSALDRYIGGWRGGDLSLYVAGNGSSAAGVDKNAYDVLDAYKLYDRADYYFSNAGTDTEQTAMVAKLNSIIDNITQYSGTNVESGLLLAKDLLTGDSSIPAKAKKSIVLMTDGETAASSTFAALFRDELEGVNLANVYEMSCDESYIDALYDNIEGKVNPFDGNWHNVDVVPLTKYAPRIVPYHYTGTTPAPPTMYNKAKALADKDGIDSGIKAYFDGLPSPTISGFWNDLAAAKEFLGKVHGMLETLLAVDGTGKYIEVPGVINAEDATFWNDAVRSLFWQADALTFAYTPSDNNPSGKTYFDVGEFSSGMPVPFNKPDSTQLLDYRETSDTTNTHGSNAATVFAKKAAEDIKSAGISLYTVGVGSKIVSPDDLKEMASDEKDGGSRHFYTMYGGAGGSGTTGDPSYVAVTTATEKLAEFALDEIDATIYPAQNVTIHDTLAAGFSFPEGCTPTVTKSYYTVGDAGLTLRETAPAAAASADLTIAGQTISVNVGEIWDTATARIYAERGFAAASAALPDGTPLYVKATIKFPINIDAAVLQKEAWSESNSSAHYTYTLAGEGKTGSSYISPKIRNKKVTPEVGTPDVRLVLSKALTDARTGQAMVTNQTFTVVISDAGKPVATVNLKADGTSQTVNGLKLDKSYTLTEGSLPTGYSFSSFTFHNPAAMGNAAVSTSGKNPLNFTITPSQEEGRVIYEVHITVNNVWAENPRNPGGDGGGGGGDEEEIIIDPDIIPLSPGTPVVNKNDDPTTPATPTEPKDEGETETEVTETTEETPDTPTEPSEPTGEPEVTEPALPQGRRTGGSDPSGPQTLGRTEYNADGELIEYNPDGTPLGRWVWDEEEEIWILEDIPLGALPATGSNESFRHYAFLVALCAACLMAALPVRPRRGRHQK